MSNLVEQQVPEGYQQTEAGVIPNDWECKFLGELGNVVRGGSPRPAGDPKYFNGNYIPWLTVASLTNIPPSQLRVNATSTMLTKLGSSQSRTLESGTLIISNSGATLGVAKILGIKCCANDGVAAIINQRDGDKEFLVQYINTKTKELHDEVATGNGQPNLNTGLIREVPVPFPPEEEQAAIANALSDVDALITSLEILIVKKCAIKTAAMQQLLTGKKRLPPFDQARTGYKQTELGEIPEDWEVKSYGQAFNFLKTASNSRDDLNDNGEYQYVHYGDIHVKWSSIVDFSKSQLPKIDGSMVNNANLIKDGDLIMADASEDYDGIGKSVEVKGLSDSKAISGLHTFLMRDVGVFVVGYRGYLHLIKSTKKSFDRLATGLKVYGLSKGNLKEVLLPVPPKEEQTLIAGMLSDMSKEVDTLSDQLLKTKNLKQGMMQELLTGRTRLV